MRIRSLIPAILMLALLMCITIVSDDISADISKIGSTTTISGEVTLTEDTFFDDGSNIVIADKTVLDVSTFTLDFGEGSRIGVAGSATIMSHNGKIIVRQGSPVALMGVALPGLEKDVCYSFDGSVIITKDYLGSGTARITLVPAEDDDRLNISWEHTVLSIMDPEITVRTSSNGPQIKCRFTSADYVTDHYDSGTLVSKETITVKADRNRDAMDATLTKNGPVINSLDIKEIDETEEFMETGIVNRTTVTEIGPTSLSTDSMGLQHISTKAEMAVMEKYEKDKLQWKETVTKMTLSVVTDPTVLGKMILSLSDDTQILSEMLKSLRFTAESSVTEDYENDRSRTFTNIVLVVDGNDTSDSYMSLDMDEGDTHIRAEASKMDFASFTMSRKLVLDTDVTVSQITVTKQSPDNTSSTVIADARLKATDLDIYNLYKLYSRAGKITVQQLLDCSERLEVSFESMTRDSDDDGVYEMSVNEANGLLSRDGKGLNTMTVGFSDLFYRTGYGEGTAVMEFDRTMSYLESNGSLSECLDAFTSGVNFTTDAHSELQIANAGFSVLYEEEGKTIDVRSGKLSSTAATLSVVMSIDHSNYLDQSVIDGKVSAIGYYVTVKEDKQYTDPEGSMEVTVTFNDMTGSFGMTFDESIGFSMSLRMPWHMDMAYYDIEFQADGEGLNVETTHGQVWVEDYDYATEGIIAMFDKMSDNDFKLDTRMVMTAKSITILKDSRTIVFDEFRDVELDIRGLDVVMKRGLDRHITLDRVHLGLVYQDGTVLDRSIGHLDLTKDLSGAEPEESLLETLAPYLTILFAAVSAILAVILVYILIKDPERFKFSE